MNKLEAADKLAKAIEILLCDETYLCYYCHQKNYEHSQGCGKQATMKLLESYRQAPAIPPLEAILEAMEMLNKVALGAEYVKVAKSSEALDTLAELRKAVKP